MTDQPPAPTIFDLVRKSDGAVIQSWAEIPARFDIPEAMLVVFAAASDWQNEAYAIVQRSAEGG